MRYVPVREALATLGGHGGGLPCKVSAWYTAVDRAVEQGGDVRGSRGRDRVAK